MEKFETEPLALPPLESQSSACTAMVVYSTRIAHFLKQYVPVEPCTENVISIPVYGYFPRDLDNSEEAIQKRNAIFKEYLEDLHNDPLGHGAMARYIQYLKETKTGIFANENNLEESGLPAEKRES